MIVSIVAWFGVACAATTLVEVDFEFFMVSNGNDLTNVLDSFISKRCAVDGFDILLLLANQMA